MLHLLLTVLFYMTHACRYVIGTQESCPLSDWERLVSAALGPSYVRIATESLMAISLLVYAQKQVGESVCE
jgi:hypothetical protein